MPPITPFERETHDKPRRAPAPSPLRVALLSLLFLFIVIFTVIYHQTFFIPIFLGLLTLVKTLLNSLTPEFIILLVKNSLFVKLRQFIARGSAHFLVLSHRPSRLKLRTIKLRATAFVIELFRRYMRLPLWLRTLIALTLLILTASSSYVFIALLIIPQPLLNWVKNLIMGLLNKLGITQAFSTIWRYFIPVSLQNRWDIYQKWTLGRRQIITARRLHSRLSEVPMLMLPREAEKTDSAAPEDQK